MTPYNVDSSLYRALQAQKRDLTDPGAGGTVQVFPHDLNILKIDTTGARTLQAASVLAVGTLLLISVTAGSVTVNGTAIGDGVTSLWVVGRDASAANEWQILA